MRHLDATDPTVAPVPGDAPAADGAPVDGGGHLDDEWDERFAWRHGRRFWNVGCG